MLAVSEPIIRRIAADCIRNFGGIFPKNTDFDRLARDFVSPERSLEELDRLARATGGLQGKRLLEIGSGYGLNLALARERFGAESFGVEPGEQFFGTYEISRDILRENGQSDEIVKQGVGEAVPYPDASFDVVYSNNVLEHVQDPARVIREGLRVLKPGGWLYYSFPNYGSWWEGHYGLLFPPHSPKWLFKIIVRLFGRDPAFVDTLQFITYGKLKRWLRPHESAIEVKTFGWELFEERLNTLEFSEWALLGRLKRITRAVKRLGLIRPVIWLSRLLHWETPFILALTKK